MTTGRLLRLAMLGVVPIVFLVAADTGLGQCPEVVPYKLLPVNWPCPVLPACGTQYGVCRLPYVASAGQPCYCQAAESTWISGVVIRGSSGR